MTGKVLEKIPDEENIILHESTVLPGADCTFIFYKAVLPYIVQDRRTG